MMNLAFQLVIFDLDGTIADTAPDVHLSMNILRSQLGLPPIALQEAKNSIGPGPDRFVKNLSNHRRENIQKLIRRFRKIYSRHLLDRTSIFPGMRETITKLYRQGIHLMVGSNKPKEYSHKLLQGLGIDHFFQSILGPEDVKNQKPAPDLILKALQLSSVSPDRALMVGDTEYDILAAKSAGIKVCGVGYGYTAIEYLKSKNPDFFILHPEELLPLIVEQIENSLRV